MRRGSGPAKPSSRRASILALGALLFAANLTGGCFGSGTGAGAPLDFRASARAHITDEWAAPDHAASLARLRAASQSGRLVIHVRELEVALENPEFYMPARDRRATDQEWDTAVGGWRDRYAMMLVNVVQPKVPDAEIVVVSEDVTPTSGLLLTSRLHAMDPVPQLPWGYFSLSLIDLASGQEIYYARLEVPRPDQLRLGWIHDQGMIVMAYSHIIERLLDTGRVSGARVAKEAPWFYGRSKACSNEASYWRDRGRAVEATVPELTQRWRERADALDAAGEAAFAKLPPECHALGASACMDDLVEAYGLGF